MSPHATRISARAGVEQGGGGGPRQWIMGDTFEKRMPHHDGIRALWETRWKFPCSKSLYPFHDGAYQDFEPIFEQLIQKGINDATSPSYTLSFLPTAARLTDEAHHAAATGNPQRASSLFLRACALYRIARFPYITCSPRVNDTTKWRAWEAQKAAYLAAGQLWEAKVEEVRVPFRGEREGDREGGIPVYVRVPTGRMMRENGLRPVVVLMTGLDGYRPDNTGRCDEFLKRGWAAVVVEIPGTADCPADPSDPESPDRMWTSLLDWMAADGRFDMSHVMVWGLSCGGYYAVRIAHTHRDRLIGCVAQGAGCHYFFEPEWLEKADGHEYPFQLLPALAMKHGYGSVEEYKAGVQRKFSLLENGVIHRPSTRLLLINGTLDGLMPVEDSMMLFEFGSPKEARFFTGALHMGYPMANDSVYPWMEQVMASAAV
ncbi:esterase FrsA [Staphylotrichum tortipilum]|uniref:Esterase FrsA n=1 Tax=Staphylotrichum tortipilum TaxID=2831512 RepID=A0AAN6MKM6_9PEZI|nr:esterase FrsA [Staphylotrichum longicolle]